MKRVPLAAAVLTLGGCFSLETKDNPYLIDAPTEPSVIRTIPHTFALSQLAGRGVSMTIKAFNTGTLATRGESVSSRKSYGAKVKLDIPAILLHHSQHGYILIGTGLSPLRERQPDDKFMQAVRFLASFDYTVHYSQKKEQDLISQLKKEGVSPADIKWVIIPFWSAGTVGMLDSFPDATVVISEREWEWRKEIVAEQGKTGPLDPSIFAGKIKLQPADIYSSPSFGAFENGLDLFKDGSLVLVNLPGRSPGNIGVWMNLDDGPLLLTGGATYVIDNYLDLALPVKGKFHDLGEYWQSLHVIQAMREGVPQLVVLPGNDLAPLRLLYHRGDIKIVP